MVSEVSAFVSANAICCVLRRVYINKAREAFGVVEALCRWEWQSRRRRRQGEVDMAYRRDSDCGAYRT